MRQKLTEEQKKTRTERWNVIHLQNQKKKDRQKELSKLCKLNSVRKPKKTLTEEEVDKKIQEKIHMFQHKINIRRVKNKITQKTQRMNNIICFR